MTTKNHYHEGGDGEGCFTVIIAIAIFYLCVKVGGIYNIMATSAAQPKNAAEIETPVEAVQTQTKNEVQP